MRQLISIALLAFAPLSATAQVVPTPTPGTATLRGRVTDATTGLPLANARAILVGTRFSGTADSAGNFVIANITPGRYELQTRWIGYLQEVWPDIELDGNRVVEFNVELAPANAPRIIRPRPGQPPSAGVLGLRARFADRAHVLGWPNLRDTLPPSRTFELRIEHLGGLMVTPASFTVLRVVISPDTVTGEFYQGWLHRPGADLPIWARDSVLARCITPNMNTTICPVALPDEIWRVFADSVLALDLGHQFVDIDVIRDYSNVTDQDNLWAEASIDGEYRSVTYYATSFFKDAQTAALRGVNRLVRRIVREVVYGLPPR